MCVRRCVGCGRRCPWVSMMSMIIIIIVVLGRLAMCDVWEFCANKLMRASKQYTHTQTVLSSSRPGGGVEWWRSGRRRGSTSEKVNLRVISRGLWWLGGCCCFCSWLIIYTRRLVWVIYIWRWWGWCIGISVWLVTTKKPFRRTHSSIHTKHSCVDIGALFLSLSRSLFIVELNNIIITLRIHSNSTHTHK